METDKRTAVIVGVLFVVATGFFSVGQAVYQPLLGSPEYLDLAGPRSGRITAGILIEVVGVLAIPLTAIFLFPVMKRYGEALALAYVGLRILEAVPLLLVDGNMLALVAVSKDHLAGGAPDPALLLTVGSSIQSMSNSIFLVSVALVFPVGAILLNSVLFRARLVPRFISVWGFLAAALLLGGSVLSFFDVFAQVHPVALEATLAGPIALQEMVFAFWLIAKGFDGKQGPPGRAT